MSTRTRVLIIAVAVPVGLVALLFAAWAVDTQRGADRVVRNVNLAGRSVGGMDRAELAPVVAGIAERYPAATVRVETDSGDVTFSGEEVGLTLDEEATVDATLEVGRGGSVVVRPFTWLASLVSPR
ncbi:MAG TPA: hypothetical protein VM386_06975, partial [Acidimicrobiales bacterium]|nr:hypothetical protein [Acidimicrobiales bacterium]